MRALPENLYYYMKANDNDLVEIDHFEDIPDGAWWAKLEDCVMFWNREHNTQFDPFESVHTYIRMLERKQCSCCNKEK